LELAKAEIKKEMTARAKGRGSSSGMSGRSLFIYKPSLFVDDEDAAGDADYDIEEGEEGEGDAEDRVTDDGPTKEWQAEVVLEAPINEALFLESIEDLDLPDGATVEEVAAAVAEMSVNIPHAAAPEPVAEVVELTLTERIEEAAAIEAAKPKVEKKVQWNHTYKPHDPKLITLG
jgi:hypothetical protein